MQNPIKCYNVESFGSIHRVYADQSVDAEYIHETLNIGKVSVFQFSYTEYLITDNWLIYMEDYLRKKGLFKFKTKKLFRDAQRSLRSIIKTVEQSSEPDYCNEYANQLYDMTTPILKRLHEQISKKLANLGVGRPGLCALMIVVQNLICMSSDTFEHIFKRIQEIRHIDVRSCFAPMFPVRALKSIEMMLESIMGEDRNTYRDNIVKNKAIKATFDAFFKTLYSQDNIKKASRAAYAAMSDEQRERYTLLEDGACVLKEYVDAKKKENSNCAC